MHWFAMAVWRYLVGFAGIAIVLTLAQLLLPAWSILSEPRVRDYSADAVGIPFYLGVSMASFFLFVVPFLAWVRNPGGALVLAAVGVTPSLLPPLALVIETPLMGLAVVVLHGFLAFWIPPRSANARQGSDNKPSSEIPGVRMLRKVAARGLVRGVPVTALVLSTGSFLAASLPVILGNPTLNGSGGGGLQPVSVLRAAPQCTRARTDGDASEQHMDLRRCVDAVGSRPAIQVHGDRVPLLPHSIRPHSPPCHRSCRGVRQSTAKRSIRGTGTRASGVPRRIAEPPLPHNGLTPVSWTAVACSPRSSYAHPTFGAPACAMLPDRESGCVPDAHGGTLRG